MKEEEEGVVGEGEGGRRKAAEKAPLVPSGFPKLTIPVMCVPERRAAKVTFYFDLLGTFEIGVVVFSPFTGSYPVSSCS